MTTPSELALADTNILVASLYKDHEHHLPARRLVQAAVDGQLRLCLTSQVLAEFYAVTTNPKKVSNPLTPEEARGEVAKYAWSSQFVKLPVSGDVVARWVALAARRPITRGKIFDLQLVATMLSNGVTRIYTFNRRDFEVFDEIVVLTP
jgi:predicted nucleic acid-binding protein